MSSSNEIVKTTWPRWLFALVIGVPVVGCGYYYMRRKSSKTIQHNKKTLATEESIDEKLAAVEAPKEETPLQRSLNLKNSGNEFYRKKEYDDALRCYSEAISICPEDEKEQLSMLYHNKAAVLDVQRDMEGVIEFCSKAIELNPAYTKALTRRYKAYEKLGDLKRCLDDLTALCILEKFSSMSTLEAADRILKALGTDEAKKFYKTRVPSLPSKHFAKAYFTSFANDPISKDLDEYKGKDLESASGLTAIKVALANDEFEKLLDISNKVISETSSEQEKCVAMLVRASLRILRSERDLALEDLNYIIECDEADSAVIVNALLRRACLHMQVEDATSSLADFVKAEQIDDTNSDIYHQRAQVMLLMEKIDEAVSDFRKTCVLCPKFGLAHLQKAYAEFNLYAQRQDIPGMRESATELKETALKYSHLPEGHMLAAQVSMEFQEFSEAEKSFDTALKVDPSNASVYVHKGLLILRSSGDMTKALEMMQKAIDLDDKCEFAYESMGSVEVQRGNLVKAIEHFEKAMNLVKSERELAHIITLKAAAEAQIAYAKRLGLNNVLGQPI